jgi:hypothetical protein
MSPEKIGKYLIYEEDGKHFRLGRFSSGVRRRYGTIKQCSGCEKQIFSAHNKITKERPEFCSFRCAKFVSFTKANKTPKVKHLDAMFAKLVKTNGECVSGRKEHNGGLQCAHGFSRRYRLIRWDMRNAFPFCAGCHIYFTHRPLEWEQWLRVKWGDELYEEMKQTALQDKKADLKEVYECLKKLTQELSLG